MSEFIKAQQEVRANLTQQIREVIDNAEAEKRGLDAEELEKIDRIEDDIRRADEAIAVAQRNEERNVEASVAAKGFALPEQESRSADEILRQIAQTRGSHTFNREERVLVPTTNTVPKTFFDQVFDVARLVGPMLDVGQRINTTSGEDITIPTLTAYSTATLKAAGSALADSEPTYSSITLGAYKYGLLIPVANELITDAGFDISSHLAEQAGNGLGFAVNAQLTTGSGSDQPNGVVTAAAAGGTGGTGVSGAFTADNLIDLQYSLDGAARRLPGVAYMANGSTIGAMRKLKDKRWSVPIPGTGWTARHICWLPDYRKSCVSIGCHFGKVGAIRTHAFIQGSCCRWSPGCNFNRLLVQHRQYDLPCSDAS